ncbi:MAG: HAD family hydrolase [Candidatus Aenigmarchaeota archaeon]|nr:HAD family hydrolase [Candidatus Aenigmarchaeota archaeon]
MNNISAIIFDMDGVISDTEHLHKKANDEVLKELGIIIDKKDRDRYVGIPTKHYFRRILKKHKNLDINDIMKINNEKLKQLIVKEMKPISGAIELINNIKDAGYKTAVASSTELELIEFILERIGVRDRFDNIVSGSDLDNPKPAPDVFLITAKELDVMPEECLVIEDSANGVRAAKSAGMRCIGFTSANSGNQDLSKADIVVDDLKKININLIKRL